jgi:hypothetical protein
LSMKLRVVYAFFLLLTICRLPAIELYLAPLAVQDETGKSVEGQEKPEADLLQAFQKIAVGEAVSIRSAPIGSEELPRSFLDAARLSEWGGYQYLLYGYVKKGEYSYSAEVKLLERERKEVVSVFFAGDDRAHYQRLMDDLAGKILDYFYREVGVQAPEKGPEPERNLLSFPLSLGYWTPAVRDWGRVVAGLGALNAGVRFIPVRNGNLYFSLGADLEYALGMNEQSYESFFLHTAKLRLPIEGVFELGRGQSFGLWLGPLLQIDVLAQTRHYEAPFTGVTAVMGLSFGFLYRCVLTDTLALGFANVFDVAMYTIALVEYSPRVFVEFSLGSKGDG